MSEHGRELPITQLCDTYSQASIFPMMVKLIGNDTIILSKFLQIPLPRYTHLFWHNIGTHVFYHFLLPILVLLVVTSFTRTLIDVFMDILDHGRPINPNVSNSSQSLS